MKKILFVLALAASVQVVSAQTEKNIADARKAIENAEQATQNPKKASNVQTWMNLGKAYMSAYDAPAGNAIVGMDSKLMAGIKTVAPDSTVTVAGGQYIKKTFPTANLYVNGNEVIEIIEKTKEVVPDPLAKAVEAYAKAASLDPDGKKSKDIEKALNEIAEDYNNDAIVAYTFEDFAASSRYFAGAVNARGTAPLSQIDTMACYNAGLTSLLDGRPDDAKPWFEKCKDLGYYGGGEVYNKLSEIAAAKGDKEASVAYLQEGFEKFPNSQSILVGLINYYMTAGDQSEKLFELLQAARQNDPNNVSIVRAQGQVYEKMGKIDEAVAAYRECSTIDPNYADGFIGEGLLYYNLADKIAEQAQNELNDKKYESLLAKLKESLRNSLPAFQKAYEICTDPAQKVGVGRYIKDIAFRLRNDGDEYMKIYETYNQLLEGK